MKYAAAAALAALIAGCSGVSPIPSNNAPGALRVATPSFGSHAKKKCHKSKVMPVGIAGFITLPSCFGISGKIQFPKALTSGITITVTTSAKPFHVYHAYPQTAVVLEWVFTDPSIPTGTQIVFDYTHTGRTAPDVVNGPFKPSTSYSAVFEIPNPTDPRPKNGLTIVGYTVGHSVRGIPFPGTQVDIGAKNYEIFTSDPNP